MVRVGLLSLRRQCQCEIRNDVLAIVHSKRQMSPLLHAVPIVLTVDSPTFQATRFHVIGLDCCCALRYRSCGMYTHTCTQMVPAHM